MRPQPAASPERELPLDGAPFSASARNLFVEFCGVCAMCVRYEYVCFRSRVIVVIYFNTKCLIVRMLSFIVRVCLLCDLQGDDPSGSWNCHERAESVSG